MKKFFLLAVASILLIACHHHRHGTMISYYDGDDGYTMKARFKRQLTADVHAYLNDVLGYDNNINFNHTRHQATYYLNDHSRFYMENVPGYLVIRIPRYRNSEEAYERVREACEGLKDVIVEER